MQSHVFQNGKLIKCLLKRRYYLKDKCFMNFQTLFEQIGNYSKFTTPEFDMLNKAMWWKHYRVYLYKVNALNRTNVKD